MALTLLTLSGESGTKTHKPPWCCTGDLNAQWILRILVLVTLFIWMSACSPPPLLSPTPNLDKTAAAQNVADRLTQVATLGFITDTPIPLTPTFTASPTVPVTADRTPTIFAEGNPQATSTTSETFCDRVSFVSDITVPDGTQIPAATTFTKTWRLKNSGACAWNANYMLVFYGRHAMGAPATQPLTSRVIAPGQELEASIELKAPPDPGFYRGEWILRNPSGITFGLGPNADQPFWVEIEVVPP